MEEPWASLVALADDRTLGALETAGKAARLLPRVPREDLADAIETVLRGHPSMAPLWRLADALLAAEDHAEAAQRFLGDIDDDRRAAAVLAPELPGRLLTISSSSTVKETVAIRHPSAVMCMASHPGGEGLLMAGALSAWCDALVMDDDEALGTVPAEAVVVGADAVTPTGIVNKVKTRALAEAALARSVPCYVVAGNTKLVPEELPVVDPFEAVPLGLFTRVAVPAGLLLPDQAGGRAASTHLHPALRALTARL